MIEDEDHPAMLAALQDLKDALQSVIGKGVPLTGDGLAKIAETVENRRQRWRHRGVAIPKLALLPLVRQGVVKLYRRDLPNEMIQIHVLNIVNEYPNIGMDEVAAGVRVAWPSYRPVDDNPTTPKGLMAS